MGLGTGSEIGTSEHIIPGLLQLLPVPSYCHFRPRSSAGPVIGSDGHPGFDSEPAHERVEQRAARPADAGGVLLTGQAQRALPDIHGVLRFQGTQHLHVKTARGTGLTQHSLGMLYLLTPVGALDEQVNGTALALLCRRSLLCVAYNRFSIESDSTNRVGQFDRLIYLPVAVPTWPLG